MSLKTVIVNGAFGKMGAVTCETVESSSHYQLVAKLGRDDNLEKEIKSHKPDIIIDFTNALCAYENAKTIIDNQTHAIIGTSGLKKQEITQLTSQCERQKLGAIIVPNFSLGAILMMKCAALIAPYLTEVEIIETHHPKKIDAPSGTAIKTAELIAKKRGEHLAIDHSQPARGEAFNDISIHALRLPGFVASQQVIFGGEDENLTLSHHSISRQSFMPGVLLALDKVTTIAHLVYGLEHFIGD
jgi:4-hydroxy-tetrahydrodipicolinate reductase